MGFLNSILRSVKREVENDASRKVSNSISSSITGLFNKQGSSNNNTSTPSQGTPAPSNDRYQGFVIGGNSSGGSITLLQTYSTKRTVLLSSMV